MAVRLPALRAGRPLPPGRLVALTSVRGWVDPRAIVRLEGLGKLKNVHLIGIRTRDLPACNIVPLPSTLPRTPDRICVSHISLPVSRSNNCARANWITSQLSKYIYDRTKYVTDECATTPDWYGTCINTSMQHSFASSSNGVFLILSQLFLR
jgi:hypothetical protein